MTTSDYSRVTDQIAAARQALAEQSELAQYWLSMYVQMRGIAMWFACVACVFMAVLAGVLMWPS